MMICFRQFAEKGEMLSVARISRPLTAIKYSPARTLTPGWVSGAKSPDSSFRRRNFSESLTIIFNVYRRRERPT